MANKGRKPQHASRRRQARPSGGWPRLATDAAVAVATALICCFGLALHLGRDLPETSALWRHSGGPQITLLAADGAPLPVHGAASGAPIRLADLPAHVPQAILAVEDRNFYHHFGVNVISIIRAALVNLREGGVVQGGSTITQQLAKNVFLSPERTLRRKAQELILALWLEGHLTKDEILTLYLNRVYFGAGAYGIDAASHRYFGKPARDLSVSEAALLAGLLRAPSKLAPTHNPEKAGRRARLVLDQMVRAGFLSERRALKALEQPVRLSSARLNTSPYFVDYVLREARAIAGDIDADLIVHTTFDRDVQEAAEVGLAAGVALRAEDLQGAEAAAAILDRSGAVLALVGGRDYRYSQFNRAVQARRQPGSAFKPFVYLAAIESGKRADDRVLDAPVRVGTWAPDNYKSRFYGDVSYREALARSLNAATVRVQETIGRSAVRRTARAMGFEGKLNKGPALALGVDEVSPLWLAGAYAPFANGGYKVRPYVINRVETADGDVLFRRDSVYLSEAASPSSIRIVNEMMRGVVIWGTGKAAAIPGYDAAGKTGTSQNSRDAWFAGHAGGLVGAVWVGRDDNGPMPGVTGGGPPAVIWREVMGRALPPRYVAPVQELPRAEPTDPIAALLQIEG
ncbi:MAG: PBP1A family penicillin-binding protein [Pseudomonadota bacterium]